MFGIHLLFIQMLLIYLTILMSKACVMPDSTKFQLFLTSTFIATIANQILVIDHGFLALLSYRLDETLQVITFKKFYFSFMDQIPNDFMQAYSFYIKLATATISTLLILHCTRRCIHRNNDPSYTPKPPSIRLNYVLIVFCLLPFITTWINRYRFPITMNTQLINGIALLAIMTIALLYYRATQAVAHQSHSNGFFGKVFGFLLIIQLLFVLDITFKIGLLVWAPSIERGIRYGYYPTSPSYVIFNALTAINTVLAFFLSFKLYRAIKFG